METVLASLSPETPGDRRCVTCGRPLPAEARLTVCSACAFGSVLRFGGEGWPEILGYEMLREAGEGGMGRVFQARQVEAGGRLVAVKVLKENVVSPRMAERFAREVAILSALSHPHLATVYEAGRTEGGARHMILEWIEGEPLTLSWQRRGAGMRTVVAEMVKTCEGVQAAHAVNVVHRDLKPTNVLCGDEGRVLKVVDFGLARETETEREVSLSGTVVGTIGYMALEQGQGKPTGPPADVFSLGVMLYQGLTDRMPFPTASLYENLQAQERGDVVAFGKDAPPRDLQAILRKALEADPVRRYRNAGEMAEDLANFLAGRPVTAQPPSAIYRARKFAARHRTSTAITTTALVAALALGGWHLRSRAEAARELQAEYAATLLVSAELAGQRGLWREALNFLDQAKQAGARHPGRVALAEVEALDALGRRAEAAAALKAATPVIDADAGIPAGMIAYWQAQFCEGFGGVDRALVLLRQGRNAGLPPAEASLADALLTDDEGEAAEILARAAQEHPAHSKILFLHSLVLAFTGQPDEARIGIAAARRLFPQNAELPLLEGIVTVAAGEAGEVTDERWRHVQAIIGREKKDLYNIAWSGLDRLPELLHSPQHGLVTSFDAALPPEGLEGLSSLSLHFITMTRRREAEMALTVLAPWTTKAQFEAMLDEEMTRRRPSLLRATVLIVVLAEDTAKNKGLAEKLERSAAATLEISGGDPALHALLLDHACAVLINLWMIHKDEAARERLLACLRRRLDLISVPLAATAAEVFSRAAIHGEEWTLVRPFAARMLELSPESAEARLRLASAELRLGEFARCLRLLQELPDHATPEEREVAEKFRHEARAGLHAVMGG